MSIGLSSLTTFNIRTDLDQSPGKRNLFQKQPYLRQSSLGLDQEDERKITLEGWSQSNESFLFANADEKQDSNGVNEQTFQKNYSKVCKNALNNLSEGLALMHKKKQVETVVESLQKVPVDVKPKESIDKHEKVEKPDFEFVTRVKTSQTAYSSSFEAHDARHKQEQRSKFISDARTNDFHSMQGDTKGFSALDPKGFSTVDAKGFSIDIEKLNDTMNNNNNERFDKTEKPAQPFYRPPSKSHRTPRNEILTMKESSRNASPMTTTKLKIHVINFKTKPLPSQASILDRFKIFSKDTPKPDNQLKIKSARTVSMNLDENRGEQGSQSPQSPTPRYIPLSENSPKKRNAIGKARFTNSTDMGMEMKIRGFGLQEPVSPPKKAISMAEQKETLKKIFGTKRELGNNEGRNGKQKSIYNILEAFKMQPANRLGLPNKGKFARGQSMTNDILEEPKEAKPKEMLIQKVPRNTQSMIKPDISGSPGEDLEGVIQSIFDLRKTLFPKAGFEQRNKKNAGKDFSTSMKHDSNIIIVPNQSKDFSYSSYSKMVSMGSSKRLIVKNGGPRKDGEVGRASTHRERDL